MRLVFVLPDGTRREIEAEAGISVMEVARRNGLDVEGACDGALACSTCHVIVDPAWFAKLPRASEEETDMLDLAEGLKRTSRLCCQIVVRPELDGLTMRLPASVNNLLAR